MGQSTAKYVMILGSISVKIVAVMFFAGIVAAGFVNIHQGYIIPLVNY